MYSTALVLGLGEYFSYGLKHTKALVANHSGGKNICSSHDINQKVLTQIILMDIRCKAMWAQNSREKPRENTPVPAN